MPKEKEGDNGKREMREGKRLKKVEGEQKLR